jgi:hypothetical protein
MMDKVRAPDVVGRAEYQAQVDALRVREKAHTREGDAIASARRRLPMVAVDRDVQLVSANGPVTLLDAFEGRRMLIAYYFMWRAGRPMRGLHLLHDAGTGTLTLAFPRRHLRNLLPRPLRGKRTLSRLHGLEDALVLGREIARHTVVGPPARHDAPRLLPAAGIGCLRDLLDDEARRRGNGQQLPPARSDSLRTAGALGKLAGRLAAALGRRERQAPFPDRWTPDLAMGSLELRALRRTGSGRR